MVHNVQQVLLKSSSSSIIVSHGPIEMCLGGFCCFRLFENVHYIVSVMLHSSLFDKYTIHIIFLVT